MSFMEKQMEMNKAIFEINQNTLQELAKTQSDSLKKYFEMNDDFSKRVPDVKDVTSFVELQREYGETLWNGMKEATKTQAEILRGAVEDTGVAVRKAFDFQAAD